MDNFVELTTLFRLPFIWCAIVLFVGGGVLGLASPRTIKKINSAFASSVDPDQKVGILDRVVDTDRVLLKYARVLGMSSLATATVLIYQLF